MQQELSVVRIPGWLGGKHLCDDLVDCQLLFVGWLMSELLLEEVICKRVTVSPDLPDLQYA